eukprot:TRINITY_DN15574_c0_g1_i1.p1 TRINITY_DN15574_c0_g1~~TRINITY_DN15574_c0_g1_i1.p1  ORF type:complete len:194 (+),score=9.36 TRINITY_DN15574_c0_g1_i1:57-638(+)
MYHCALMFIAGACVGLQCATVLCSTKVIGSTDNDDRDDDDAISTWRQPLTTWRAHSIRNNCWGRSISIRDSSSLMIVWCLVGGSTMSTLSLLSTMFYSYSIGFSLYWALTVSSSFFLLFATCQIVYLWQYLTQGKRSFGYGMPLLNNLLEDAFEAATDFNMLFTGFALFVGTFGVVLTFLTLQYLSSYFNFQI